MNSYVQICFWQILPLVVIPSVAALNDSENRDECSDLVVKTEDGLVRGWCGLRSIPSGRQIYSFTRIPYARPPIGQLRFQSPQPPELWKGIYDATRDLPECPQFRPYQPGKIAGQEDCLYLNVYTPKNPKESANLPVLFHIHGGSHQFASGGFEIFGPEKLMEENIVFVSINYRLEPLGFFAVSTCESPGNYGSKDAATALCWVNRNIRAFGGNPNDVTIQGQSAGSTMASTFLTSPMTRGLFSKVIMQSGVFWWGSIDDDPAALSYRIAESANCPLPSVSKKRISHRDMLDCLRSKTADEIILAYNRTTGASLYGRAIPTIEPVCPDVEPYLTEHPRTSIQEGRFQRAPILFGEDKHEGVLATAYHRFSWDDYSNRFFQTVLPLLRADSARLPSPPAMPSTTREFLNVYYQGQDFSNASQTYLSTVNLGSDSMFFVRHDNFMYLMLEQNIPVYEYLFGFIPYDKKTNTRLIKCIYNVCSNITVNHGQEMFYLFTGLKYWTLIENPENEEDHRMSRILVRLFTNFVIHGSPTISWETNPDLRGLHWPPSTPGKRQHLRIEDTFKMQPGDFTTFNANIPKNTYYFNLVHCCSLHVSTRCLLCGLSHPLYANSSQGTTTTFIHSTFLAITRNYFYST